MNQSWKQTIMFVFFMFNFINPIHVSQLFGENISSHNSHQTNLHDYYNYLKSASADSSNNQIKKFKAYLWQHGDFERIYWHLLEQFLYRGQMDAAKQLFHRLENRPAYFRNSVWMLAKILVLQDSLAAAFECYNQALAGAPPSILLLDDFILFDYRTRGKFHCRDKIEQLTQNSTLKKLTDALYCRRNQKFEKIIHILSKIPTDSEKQVFALHLLGYAYYELSHYSRAESYWQQALSVAQEQDDLSFQANCLTSLGVLKNVLNNDAKALEYYQAAIKIARSVNDLGRIQFVRGNLAALYRKQKQYTTALEQNRLALDISIPLGMFEGTAFHYNCNAHILNELNRISAAIRAFNQSEHYAQKSNNRLLLHSARFVKGKLYSKLNLNSLARHEYLEAMKLTENSNPKYNDYLALTRLADLWIEEKKYPTARGVYSKAFHFPDELVSPTHKAFCQWKIGECYYFEKDYASASQYFQRAFNAASQLKTNNYLEYFKAYTRLKLADIEVEQGRFSNALKIYQEELLKQEAQKNDDLAIKRRFGLGNAFKGSGNIEKAVRHFSQAADLIEENRTDLKIEQFRIGYFSDHVKVYQALVQCYRELYAQTGAQQYLEKLFASLTHTRGRTLQDNRLQADLSSVPTGENPEYQEYRTACTELQIIQRQIRNTPLLYDSLAASLEIARHNLLGKRLPLLESESVSPPAADFSLEQLRQNLVQLDWGMLIYHLAAGGSFVLAVNDNETRVIPLQIDPEALAATIDSLISPFHRFRESTLQATPFQADIAHRLYELLFEPVEAVLPLKKRLVIVPDQALQGLPFEMLLVDSSAKATYTPVEADDYAAHFLLHRHSITYSPGTWLVHQKHKPKSTQPAMLVLANPFSPQLIPREEELLLASRAGWRFDMLWFADQEADKIDALYDPVHLLKRGQATQAAFFKTAMNYSILHFATHAFADTLFDAFSGLVLAAEEDSTDDGLLMGYEISDLRLNCDLVTLSACETGRGKLVAGEGILGLPRLFLGAGANRVLMTQWKVNDKFTADLMPRFYDYLLNHQLPKADALQSAKRDLIRSKNGTDKLNYQHPVFWASFALYGSPGAVAPVRTNSGLVGIMVIGLGGLLWLIFIFTRKRFFQSLLFGKKSIYN